MGEIFFFLLPYYGKSCWEWYTAQNVLHRTVWMTTQLLKKHLPADFCQKASMALYYPLHSRKLGIQPPYGVVYTGLQTGGGGGVRSLKLSSIKAFFVNRLIVACSRGPQLSSDVTHHSGVFIAEYVRKKVFCAPFATHVLRSRTKNHPLKWFLRENVSRVTTLSNIFFC